jgi:hypothetical protein
MILYIYTHACIHTCTCLNEIYTCIGPIPPSRGRQYNQSTKRRARKFVPVFDLQRFLSTMGGDVPYLPSGVCQHVRMCIYLYIFICIYVFPVFDLQGFLSIMKRKYRVSSF